MREVTKKIFGRVSNMKFSLSDFVFLVHVNSVQFYE